jgi:hypothetical protein
MFFGSSSGLLVWGVSLPAPAFFACSAKGLTRNFTRPFSFRVGVLYVFKRRDDFCNFVKIGALAKMFSVGSTVDQRIGRVFARKASSFVKWNQSSTAIDPYRPFSPRRFHRCCTRQRGA